MQGQVNSTKVTNVSEWPRRRAEGVVLIPAYRIRSAAATPATSVGGMRGGAGPHTTARRASSRLWANGRAAVSAARHAGPASQQRSRHRAQTSGRSGSCAHSTRRFGRTHAIARSRRERLQGSGLAPVRRKSGISIAHARALARRVSSQQHHCIAVGRRTVSSATACWGSTTSTGTRRAVAISEAA